MFVEDTVTCDDVHWRPITYSVVDESRVELFVTKCHICVSLSLELPEFTIDIIDIVVDLGVSLTLF